MPSLIAKPDAKSDAKSDTKPDAKPLPNCQAMCRAKKQKMNKKRKEKDMSVDALLGPLNTLSLPSHCKTKQLLKNLADLPAVDFPNYVSDYISCLELVSLNAVNIQSTFMPSDDILPWHPDNDDIGYQDREC